MNGDNKNNSTCISTFDDMSGKNKALEIPKIVIDEEWLFGDPVMESIASKISSETKDKKNDKPLTRNALLKRYRNAIVKMSTDIEQKQKMYEKKEARLARLNGNITRMRQKINESSDIERVNRETIKRLMLSISQKDEEISTLLETLQEKERQLSNMKDELREQKTINKSLSDHAAKSAVFAAEYKASMAQRLVDEDNQKDAIISEFIFSSTSSNIDKQQQKTSSSLKYLISPLSMLSKQTKKSKSGNISANSIVYEPETDRDFSQKQVSVSSLSSMPSLHDENSSLDYCSEEACKMNLKPNTPICKKDYDETSTSTETEQTTPMSTITSERNSESDNDSIPSQFSPSISPSTDSNITENDSIPSQLSASILPSGDSNITEKSDTEDEAKNDDSIPSQLSPSSLPSINGNNTEKSDKQDEENYDFRSVLNGWKAKASPSPDRKIRRVSPGENKFDFDIGADSELSTSAKIAMLDPQEGAQIDTEEESIKIQKAEEKAKAKLKATEDARISAEKEAAKWKAEAEKHIAAEKEASRLKAEEEARIAAEEAAKRLTLEEEARLKAAEEARIVAEQQETARLKAVEEARIAAEQKAVKLAAQLKAAEEARIATEQEVARLKAKETARIAAEEEAAKLTAQLKAEEEARMATEQGAERLRTEKERLAKSKSTKETFFFSSGNSYALRKSNITSVDGEITLKVDRNIGKTVGFNITPSNIKPVYVSDEEEDDDVRTTTSEGTMNTCYEA